MSKLSNIAKLGFIRKRAFDLFNSSPEAPYSPAPTKQEIEQVGLNRRRRLAERSAAAAAEERTIAQVEALKGIPDDVKKFLIDRAKSDAKFFKKLSKSLAQAGNNTSKFVQSMGREISETIKAYTDPSTGYYDPRPDAATRKMYADARERRIAERESEANAKIGEQEYRRMLNNAAKDQIAREKMEPGDISRGIDYDLPYPEDYAKQDAEEDRRAAEYERKLQADARRAADRSSIARALDAHNSVFGTSIAHPISSEERLTGYIDNLDNKAKLEAQRVSEYERKLSDRRILNSIIGGSNIYANYDMASPYFIQNMQARKLGENVTNARDSLKKSMDKWRDEEISRRRAEYRANGEAVRKNMDNAYNQFLKSEQTKARNNDAAWSYGGATVGGGAIGALLGGEGNRLKGAIIGALLANAANFGRRKWKYGKDVIA